MASQAELQRQLDTINARLAAIQAILDRATRGTPQTKQLSEDKKKLEEEKNKVTQQLNNLTTTTPPVARPTSSAPSNSQDSLKNNLLI
jgi:DNA repair exonuclease SbcCD ATPase subunit